mmetsp:Transcript_3571/g.4628  ORF Transcript_3571/g.4628 Transcript_3571/m.4628 type:complete len:257 (+) Transcript_3571:110-880(+)
MKQIKLEEAELRQSNMNSPFIEKGILQIIYKFVGAWKVGRLVSQTFCHSIGSFLKQLVFRDGVNEEVIAGLIKQTPNLMSVTLDRVSCTTDALLKHILLSCPRLKYLGIAYCQNISMEVFKNKPQYPIVNIHGCWKLALSQEPNLSPATVAEIQMLALRSNSQEGFQKAMEFMSTPIKTKFENVPVGEVVENTPLMVLCSSKSFEISTYFISPSKANLIIHILKNDNQIIQSVWELTKETAEGEHYWRTSGIQLPH